MSPYVANPTVLKLFGHISRVCGSKKSDQNRPENWQRHFKGTLILGVYVVQIMQIIETFLPKTDF